MFYFTCNHSLSRYINNYSVFATKSHLKIKIKQEVKRRTIYYDWCDDIVLPNDV